MSSKRRAPADSTKKSESKKLKKEEKPDAKEKKPREEKAKKSPELTYCGGPYELTKPLPKKNKKGELVFEDEPEFRPNLTPKDVLQGGSFGGTYFRPIRSSVTGESYSGVWKELPKDWLEGLSIGKTVSSSIYDEKVNKYKAKCGGSLEMWEESGWMHKQDPYGWFMWYCRFYQGRRTEDDERQVSRWKKCAGVKGRWRNNLITKIVRSGCSYDNPGVSPVVRQTLFHWAYELTEDDYKIGAKRVKV